MKTLTNNGHSYTYSESTVGSDRQKSFMEEVESELGLA